MKKSKKSMAIAIAMIMGCLPKSSLAAPNGNNSSANEGSSLASKKPEYVVGAEKRSKKMSNSTKVGIGLVTGETILETMGFIFNVNTPYRFVRGLFSNVRLDEDKREELDEDEDEDENEGEELDEDEDEDEERSKLYGAIRNFAASQKSKQDNYLYKKIIENVYNKYTHFSEDLLKKFHEGEKNIEYDGFKVFLNGKNRYNKDKAYRYIKDRCVYILKGNDECYKDILNYFSQSPEWKNLCDAATKFGQKIVVGCEIFDFMINMIGQEEPTSSLTAKLYIGLESDFNNNINGFVDEGSMIFKYTLRKRTPSVQINNLEKKLKNEGNSKVYIVK